jgi:hypothetical protein
MNTKLAATERNLHRVGYLNEFEALQAKARSAVEIEPPTITFLRYDIVPWNNNRET